MANVVNVLLKNQPRKGKSRPWKPTGGALRWAACAGRGAACSGSSKLEVSSSACSAGTKGGRTAGAREGRQEEVREEEMGRGGVGGKGEEEEEWVGDGKAAVVGVGERRKNRGDK